MSFVHITLDLILERLDSPFVKWEIVEDETEVPRNYANEWPEMIGLFETETWWAPASDLGKIEVGERVHIKGPAVIEYTRDYDGEYDVNITWDDQTTEVKLLKAPSET